MEGKKLIKGLSPRTSKVYESLNDSGTRNIQTTVTSLSEDVLICLKCGHETLYEPCRNCNHYPIIHTYSDYSQYQVDPCEKCGLPHHQRRWICKKCGCDNPLQSTLFHYELTTEKENKISNNRYVFMLIISIIVGLFALSLYINNDGGLIRGLFMPLLFLYCCFSSIVSIYHIVKYN